MTPDRINQLEQMVERGTVRKGHIAEMLEAIKQPRKWHGLTDEYVYEMWDNKYRSWIGGEQFESIVRAIESKLMEKNSR